MNQDKAKEIRNEYLRNDQGDPTSASLHTRDKAHPDTLTLFSCIRLPRMRLLSCCHEEEIRQASLHLQHRSIEDEMRQASLHLP